MRYQLAEDIVDNMIGANRENFFPGWEGQLVLIMRGLPGSGKTTFAAEVQYHATIRGLQCVICSADHQFRNRLGDRYVPAHLGVAHAACRTRFQDAVRRALTDIIIVDNCNIREDEFMQYVNFANDHRIRFRVVQFECPSPEVAVELGRRSSAGIDGEYMRRRFDQYDQQYFQGYFARRGIAQDDRIFLVDPEQREDEDNW